LRQGIWIRKIQAMNAPRCSEFDYIDFLVATPRTCSCTEAARVQPDSPKAPAHDSFTRLLHRQEPDAEALWAEAEPLVEKTRGALVIDDSTLAKTYARRIGLVTRHWSGKYREVISGINLITLLWTDGDRKIPVDYRIFSKADGKTKNDHFWEMMLMARGRGFAPEYVLFDGWYASLENLKQIRDHGWRWVTRLKANRQVTPDDRVGRTLDEVAIGVAGVVVHLRGYGLIRVFRTDDPDGVAEYWASNDLGLEAGMRQYYAELSFAIENYHRDLKQNCGVEKCQVRSERAQRNHIGFSLRAFLRLEWHFFTTGISGFEAKLRLIRKAVQGYLKNPALRLPKPSTA
jgi:putative transposase